MKHLDLFSGIGGFALAVESVWDDVEHTFVDNDPFCQAVLKKHWPNAPIYGDIATFANDRTSESYDIVTGGFPCQPFSAAGKRKGTDDKRHLWPHMFRIVQKFKPEFVLAENVRGILTIEGGMVFEQVCADMESEGYEVQPIVVPACAVNAPHRRDRVWFAAYRNNPGNRAPAGDADKHGEAGGEKWEFTQRGIGGQDSDAANSKDGCGAGFNVRSRQMQSWRSSWGEDWSTVAARLCRVDDVLSEGVARPKGWRNAAIKAYGNAIVPQVATEILSAMRDAALVQ